MKKTPEVGDGDNAPAVNQLLDMFIYAPIGMLYEYPEVLPKLVKKGKSQVQLAKVMGEFAMRKGQADPAAFASESFASAGGAIAKLITELGEVFAASQGSQGASHGASGSSSESAAIEATASAIPPTQTSARLPIASYDSLTAREIVGLLADITPAQRARVRAHETQNRARKTVLSKLDQLGD